MEDTMANLILTELREFREENNKRWEKNDERWEENDRRWEQNGKHWNENDKRWDENDKKWEVNDKRLTDLEEERKKERLDLIDILDTMEKSITNQFNQMRVYFDVKFEKVFISQRVNDIEHDEFKKLICTHEGRLNFYNRRISTLEEWKEQFDMGEFTAV